MTIIHDNRILLCPFCSNIFIGMGKRQHIGMLFDVIALKCDICGIEFWEDTLPADSSIYTYIDPSGVYRRWGTMSGIHPY